MSNPIIKNIKSRTSSTSLIESLPIESLQNEAIISEEEVNNHMKMEILEESGNLFQENMKKIVIDAKGVQLLNRKHENGIVFFGEEGENDIVLNLKDKVYKESCIFMVYYRRDLEKYYIKMNEISNHFFCFANLVEPLKLFSGCVISLFNFNFKFTINDDKSLSVDYELESGKFLNK